MNTATSLAGLLFVGDPHLSSRVPGFRIDDYPRVALGKLQWCLEYARAESLLPVLLGDLFHWPRDNANWLVAELLALLGRDVLTVVGNHDVHEDEPTPDDTVTILARAGRLRVLDDAPWRGVIGGCDVLVGGTSWGRPLPRHVHHPDPAPRWTFWVTHHDIGFPGYVAASPGLAPRPIEGVDVVVNGHVHESLRDVVCPPTTWLNPGNITRLTRDVHDLRRAPEVLAIRLTPDAWSAEAVVVPHLHSREVFAPKELDLPSEAWVDSSLFVQGLRDLLAQRTDTGAGLMAFLESNLTHFEPRVADEIRELAREVLIHGPPGDGDPQTTLRAAQPDEDPHRG